jgi:predicted TIM-barrel enzyme
MLALAREAYPTRPLLVGGGVSAANVAEITTLADGAIVSSALKRDNDLFGELDADRARAFVAAAAQR